MTMQVEGSKQSPDDGPPKQVDMQVDPKVMHATAQVETTKSRKRSKPCGEGSKQPPGPPPKLYRTRSKTGIEQDH